MRRDVMNVKLVASTNEYSRSSCRRSHRSARSPGLDADSFDRHVPRAIKLVKELHRGLMTDPAAQDQFGGATHPLARFVGPGHTSCAHGGLSGRA